MSHDAPPLDAPAQARVLLVDDQPLVRRGVRTLLDLEDDMRVVAEAGDGVEALGLSTLAEVDVALVDVQMPRMDGVELIARLAEQHPRIACVVLTTSEDEAVLDRVLRAGARGHLLKDVEPDELVSAVRRANVGRAVLGRMAAEVLLSHYLAGVRTPEPRGVDLRALSDRERVVAQHVASGATNREIARVLCITEGTVKNHVSAILRKVDVRDRTALALRLTGADAP